MCAAGRALLVLFFSRYVGLQSRLHRLVLLLAGLGLSVRGQPDQAQRDDRGQDAQDRDHDQELDQGEPRLALLALQIPAEITVSTLPPERPLRSQLWRWPPTAMC